MAKILDILEEFLHEIEKNNPYKLIAKGGTVLSLFYLAHHRESEDLDFDTTLDKNQHKNIESYFISILERLKNKGAVKDLKCKSTLRNAFLYKINASSFWIVFIKLSINATTLGLFLKVFKSSLGSMQAMS